MELEALEAESTKPGHASTPTKPHAPVGQPDTPSKHRQQEEDAGDGLHHERPGGRWQDSSAAMRTYGGADIRRRRYYEQDQGVAPVHEGAGSGQSHLRQQGNERVDGIASTRRGARRQGWLRRSSYDVCAPKRCERCSLVLSTER